jgi:tetratricopeptide (TPR) repeat protein
MKFFSKCFVFLLLFLSILLTNIKLAGANYIIADAELNRHRVSTQNGQAQLWFDRGLTLIYAFNHEEAVKSFQKAAQIDPKLAMAYWGMALALGPNINLPVDGEREIAAEQAIQKALKLATNLPLTPKEQDYIAALATRYSSSPDADFNQLALNYKQAMGELVKRYPNDLDAATLYAESAMDLNPWRLWNADGTPQAGTKEIIEVLESVLKRNPNHLGANHYYIHAVEASPTPQLGLASARRLETLAVKTGHLIHMPSHIYYRLGDFEKASAANQKAILQDEEYIKINGSNSIYATMYYNHNIHFLAVASSMAGNYQQAQNAAKRLLANIAPMMSSTPIIEGFGGTSLLIKVSFQDWQGILDYPEPEEEMITTKAIWHFAKGMAYQGRGQIVEANREKKILAIAQKNISPQATIGFSPARDILAIAIARLEGEIALQSRDYIKARKFLQLAVKLEQGLAYQEPPDWYLPNQKVLSAIEKRLSNNS